MMNDSSTSPNHIEEEIRFHRKVAQADAKELRPCSQKKLEEYRLAKRHRQDPYHKALKLLHPNKGMSILEIGSGSGIMLTRLARLGHTITGLELSPDLVEMAKRRIELENVGSKAKIIRADACNYRGAVKYDIVFAPLVLHHLDLVQAMRSIKQLLNPGGLLIAMEPVAFCRPLQGLRNIVPVKKHISPNERQFNHEDLKLLAKDFDFDEIHYFYCLARLRRVIPQSSVRPVINKYLQDLDAHMLRIVPALKKFAGTVVFQARSKA